jgi:cysteinyl-tRNA synthetase
VFRLYDSRRRLAAQVRPAASGLLRLATWAPRLDRPAQLGELRACLVSDLIRRNAERHQLTVVSCQNITGTGEQAERLDAFLADCAALNVAPPDHPHSPDTAGSAMPPDPPGMVSDILIGGADLGFPQREQATASHLVRTGQVLFDGRELTGNAVRLGALADRGLDPLAFRLACLERHYRQRLDLTWQALTAADLMLRRWRDRVAGWAAWPSRPMCAGYSADIAAAFDADLDTPAAVRALRALERDEQIPPGSKFETFAHTDQVLALDLASQVGRPRAPSPS